MLSYSLIFHILEFFHTLLGYVNGYLGYVGTMSYKVGQGVRSEGVVNEGQREW